ncbi:17603_t:CDS:2 [Acaulospora morrowiae]|uniref:17603_t:CDS:1 n=1 Tax=Acaulospora morrowiae TaxID=94023 RepID=A0A9N9GV13_9GLOM|nr:17603_t:CDS:2 [Acaulospora morrowiae]
MTTITYEEAPKVIIEEKTNTGDSVFPAITREEKNGYTTVVTEEYVSPTKKHQFLSSTPHDMDITIGNTSQGSISGDKEITYKTDQSALDDFNKGKEEREEKIDFFSVGTEEEKNPLSGVKYNEKGYQMRALFRKTLSYQKRQMFTNICCIALCPLLMVAIAGIMGIVIQTLIDNSITADELLFCSNVQAKDQYGNFNTNDSLVPTVPADQVPNSSGNSKVVKLVNYFLPPAGDEIFSTPGNPVSCVFVFGHDYPEEPIYQPSLSKSDNNTRRDTTFMPDPSSGSWYNEFALNIPMYLSILSQYQSFPWFYVRNANGADAGSKPRQPPVNTIKNFLQNNASNPQYSGILGNIDTDYYANITTSKTLQNFQAAPFFDTSSSNSSVDEFDDLLKKGIQDVINGLANVDKAVLFVSNPPRDDLFTFYTRVASILTNMPWGNILMDVVDPSAKKWNYTLQIGTDIRISNAASFPSQGFRRIATQSKLSNGIIRTVNGTSASGINGVKITQTYRAFPQLYTTSIKLPIGTFVGGILYPFGVSFLLPIFVITLTKEKEDRILVMMQMNGLKSFTYYLTHYVHFYVLHILTTLIFVIAGLLFKMEIFTQTQPGVYIILLFIWGHVEIAMSFLFTCFFSKSRTGFIVTFLIVLCGIITSLATESLYRGKGGAPAGYFLWPPFAFYRALSLINFRSVSKTLSAYRLSDLIGGDEVLSAIIYMTVEYFVILLLSAYLNAVIPSEFGVNKPWHFIFTEPYYYLRGRDSKGRKRADDGEKKVVQLEAGIKDLDEDEIKFEDDDVKEERRRVIESAYDPESPLVMKRMRKVYPSGKLAVKDVTFAVDKNIIFGLLGPNGAGKTTLISILTGLYKPSSGSASINKFDIHTQMQRVYMSVGVCPQHDILWDDLTVSEHLLFYARLKGVPASQEKLVLQVALRQVRLESLKERLSKRLSGGEKRRLSIAIALIGSPAVVFLDEPTTGLDPEVRRMIWNIVNDAKKGRTIVLTTHSMEEAEVLCNRIGIMAKGTLRCIGPQLRLKELYGRGFRLSFSCKAKNVERATAYIESLLPESAKKLDSFVTNVSYEFYPEPGLIARLFEEIEKHKKEHGVDDWGLEEVFLRIISEADAEAE